MEEPEEMQVGKVTHYFPKIGVAIIEVTEGSIKIGDEIHIKGKTTDFRQRIISIEIDYEKLEIAEPGRTIGIKVDEIARKQDLVYRKI